MSRRIHVTLPDYVYEALERWSDQQGRPLANLGAFLIEVAIVRAIKEGEILPPPEQRSTNPPHK
ncbi:ribbon-helix-helix domain-containing protein [Phormidesmis priestleyi]